MRWPDWRGLVITEFPLFFMFKKCPSWTVLCHCIQANWNLTQKLFPRVCNIKKLYTEGHHCKRPMFQTMSQRDHFCPYIYGITRNSCVWLLNCQCKASGTLNRSQMHHNVFDPTHMQLMSPSSGLKYMGLFGSLFNLFYFAYKTLYRSQIYKKVHTYSAYLVRWGIISNKYAKSIKSYTGSTVKTVTVSLLTLLFVYRQYQSYM